ncbi:hypothetical protein [Caballeronia sp. NCTM5]|nr:hypothetical protein [Caballeronia sp. NCTM5]
MIEQTTRRLPLLGRVMSGLIATLVMVLLVLGITAAGWAILYLIRTAP